MNCSVALKLTEDRNRLYNLKEADLMDLLMHMRLCGKCKERINPRNYVESIESLIMALE